MVLSDITEREILKKKRYDASIVFSCVTACVFGVIIYKKTDFSSDELGLKIKSYKSTFGVILRRDYR